MAFSSVLRMKPLLNHRLFCSITQPDSAIHKQKIQSALSLLKSKSNNPAEQILYVCLSNTISDLPPPSSSNTIHSFLHELNTQPALMSSFLEQLKTQPEFRKECMYSHIITVYGQAGMFDSAKKTFREMPGKGIARSVVSLNALLGAALHTCRTDIEAVEIFYEYPHIYDITRNVDTYNLFLKALVHYKSEYLMISKALNQMNYEHCKPDETTCKIILAGLSERTPDEAVKVFRFMEINGMFLENIDIYNFRIQSLCKLKDPAQAKWLFEKITSRGMEPNSDTYQHLMECLCEGGHLEIAVETCMDCMKKDWFPSVYTSQISVVKTLVNELVTSSKHEEVEKMLQMMEMHGLRPNLDIYNLCMESLYKLDKSKDAKALFGRMFSTGVKPNAITYQLLISGYTKEGDVKEIKRITEEMRANGIEPDASCYKALIENISQSGDPEAVYQACKDCMKEEWFPSFLSSDPVTLKTLVKKLLIDSRQEDVGELLGRMENLGLQPSLDIYNFVIQKLYELDESDEAKEFFEVLSKKGIKLNVDTYWSVIGDLSTEGETTEMKSLFDDMIKKGVEPDQRICNQLIGDLCCEDELKKAVEVYERASSLDIKLNEETYSSLVELYCSNGSLKELEMVLSDMSKKGVDIDSDCYENIVESLCDGDCVDAALRVTYECMPKKWFADLLTEDTSAMETLVDHLKKESRFEEVWKLLEAMKKNELQPNLSLFFK